MFKVTTNKDTRTTPTSVSIVNFDQLNANWEVNINPFHSTGPFYTFWKYQKTSNFWCFQRVRNRPVVWTGLKAPERLPSLNYYRSYFFLIHSSLSFNYYIKTDTLK